MARSPFHPAIARWFESNFGSPTEPQLRGWPHIQNGEHTLIAAPTGSGKTLAAFLAELDQLFREGLEGKLRDETRVVYVSPLKALSNDIHRNLEQPLAGIRAALLREAGMEIEVRAAVRTGDTPASRRQAMARKPPHILVTTPESLYLLLTSISGRKMLSAVRTVIVDEIHALVGNRRGSHLSLTLERLDALTGARAQRIGLSATQKPIEEVARFLLGGWSAQPGERACSIVDAGYQRDMDLAIELPGSQLEAVMSNEVWTEVYTRLVQLIAQHRTTLVFVNTRRLAERVTHHLCERLGAGNVMSHHGSLSAALRLEAERRLKHGELKALVATASLELGIDIGSVDLVCQLGPTRSIATLLQRVGRAEHKRGGRPKGRLFPLSRDELLESVATVCALNSGQLDRLEIPAKPLDVLAQQIVACAACEDWDEGRLFEIVRSAYPYRDLSVEEFRSVLRMLSAGFSTKKGRRAALLHYDAINHRIRARRGARLVALTSGGAIPDNSDYRVVVEPDETFIGTVNEDFAVESLAGDIFQLGNASWRILRINSGTVRVANAEGQPPNMPFWLGEAPGRTDEVSRAVGTLCAAVESRIEADGSSGTHIIPSCPGLPAAGAVQLSEYLAATYRALGALPSQDTLMIERFFDESGGMQMVIHSPFGIRINRAWGLALRKRFCRSFNFELQAAASDDAIVLSLGTQHSFPLEEVFRYLHSQSVRALLIQALLDAPMFPVRWRWNATRALALPRQRGGHKIAAPLQRMEAENLLAAVFPDQLACLENIAGDREIPDHPLVRQTIDDCLTEAMDVEGLVRLLQRVETGSIRCIARDLPEPSPMAHEILNARPYAFLDNAPLEERRTHAVYTRRAGQASPEPELGILDSQAIQAVCNEAWPRATSEDELHDALLLCGLMSQEEIERSARAAPTLETEPIQTVTLKARHWLDSLLAQNRALRVKGPPACWAAMERGPQVLAVYGPEYVQFPHSISVQPCDRNEAVRELVRGRMEVSGPSTASDLASWLRLPEPDIQQALLALESEGFVLRGRFRTSASSASRSQEAAGLSKPNATLDWCDRRLLARIHRLTIRRLRAEIEPVSLADFQRFLVAWQRLVPSARVEGPEGLRAVLELFDGFETPAAAWEPEVLSARVNNYDPRWLDQLCFTGQVGWGRLTAPQNPGANGRPLLAPIRSSPVSLFLRENLPCWLALSPKAPETELRPDTAQVLELFRRKGAMFFGELLKQRSLLPSRVEQALAELAAQGWLTSDSFEGLRALLLPQDKRIPFSSQHRPRHHKSVSSVEFAGRWSLLRDCDSAAPGVEAAEGDADAEPNLPSRDEAVERFARTLLRRYGLLFRRLLERESLQASWFELSRVCRRLEARGEIRGGYFVAGVGGEQFALPEAVSLLRSTRKTPATGELLVISGADPLNLAGILTPGRRVAAIASNRILLRDGVPIAALEGRAVQSLEPQSSTLDGIIERSLRLGSLPPRLRPYYA